MNGLQRPDAAELLDIARTTLLAEVLPGLDPEARLKVQMIASAMAIARRAVAADPAAVAAPIDALQALAGGDLAALCAQIRAGAHDPGTSTHTVARQQLIRLAEARCRISAPKALGGTGSTG